MLSKRTAEAVSLGHPDKSADFISSYILDRFLQRDPNTRYAVEVMIKGNDVIIGGEVSSKVSFSKTEIEGFVKEALRIIGYSEEYSKLWGKDAIEIEKLKVTNLISAQSPEISTGVTNDGWGDQGVFVGYAKNDSSYNYLAKEQYYAKKLNFEIYTTAKNHIALGFGLDIKTQITTAHGKIDTVIVAVPTIDDKSSLMKGKECTYEDYIKNIIATTLDVNLDEVNIIINGTGEYKMHSAVADCGITGRKLACDFYSVFCPIGGGSPWTKDATKADVSLNIYARKLAIEHLKDNDECFVYLSSCIGRSSLPSSYVKTVKDGHEECKEFDFTLTPHEVIEKLSLREPRFASMCINSTRAFIY